MNTIILTFIIPFYNSKQYLHKCLDSIYCQNISEEIFEVICIDDFSRDDGCDVIIEFQKDHNNLFLIRNKSNRKQGYSRNVGLIVSKGQYVWFIDSDDYLERNVPMLIKHLNSSHPDILQFNANKISLNGVISHDIFLNKIIENMTGYEYMQYEMNVNYTNRIKAVWSKIFRRKFLLDNQLRFSEGVFFEDVIFSLETLFHAKLFKYVPIISYNYVETPNSDLRGENKKGKKFADTIKFCLQGIEFISKNVKEKELQMFLAEFFIEIIRKYKLKIPYMSIPSLVIFRLNIHNLQNVRFLSDFMPIEDYAWINNSIKCISLMTRKK